MNRIKLINFGLQSFFALVGIFGSMTSIMIFLLGFQIFNLMMITLSIDELYLNSPFNQTKISIIYDNMEGLTYAGAFIMVVGLFLLIITLGIFFSVISGRLSFEKWLWRKRTEWREKND